MLLYRLNEVTGCIEPIQVLEIGSSVLGGGKLANPWVKDVGADAQYKSLMQRAYAEGELSGRRAAFAEMIDLSLTSSRKIEELTVDELISLSRRVH